MTELPNLYGEPPDDDVPIPVRAKDKTKGRFLRDETKNALIDTGVGLYKSGESPSLRNSAKVIAPAYYTDWHDRPDMQSGRLKTLAEYMRDRVLNKI